ACDDPDVLLEFLVGKVSRQQLVSFVRLCWQRIAPFLTGVRSAYTVVEQFSNIAGEQTDMDAARYASEAALKGAGWAPSFTAERRQQAELLRHIAGNPLRLYSPPQFWPADVVQLAQALAAGQDCAYALHDALVEAGQMELADHFRCEHQHPQACWVLDMILASGAAA